MFRQSNGKVPLKICGHRTLENNENDYICFIIWFSNLLTMSVPDEGYYRNVSCALN